MSGEPTGVPRTTKTVTMTITATFHGDYLDADEVASHLEGWIDSGLDDRDDLRSWSCGPTTVTEVGGDPHGFDRDDEPSDETCIDGDGEVQPEHDYGDIECRRCGAATED